MRLRRSERRLARAAAALCLVAAAPWLYMWYGPFGTSPVVVHTSVLNHTNANGRYVPWLPDFVFVRPDANATTVAHETLHYAHPDWTECQVSDTLAQVGMYDSYYKMGTC